MSRTFRKQTLSMRGAPVDFAALAAQYHLATNSVYLARFDEKKAVQARLTLEADSNAGQYHDDT